MNSFLVIFTYIAYIFIVAMYTVKIIKLIRMPVHLRWELYPMMQKTEGRLRPPYDEDLENWSRHYQKMRLRGILFLLKDNFLFRDYYRRNRRYWFFMFPWHIGFILIISFHIFSFLNALIMYLGIPVSAESSVTLGRIVYYLVLFTGVISFVIGSFGSIGLMILRLRDEDLKTFATPQNYFNYLFTMIIFISGLIAWYFEDPDLVEYRNFWVGMITLKPTPVGTIASFHIILFALFLIYLPFTRSIHYLTKFIAFLGIRWDERPNIKGCEIEKKIDKYLNEPVNWDASHIQSGSTWAEIISNREI